MIQKIDGPAFGELVEYGIKNLELHKKELNDLNVFPVPDGDTGTNMLMTLKYGFESAKNYEGNLSECAEKIGSGASFGARGNSGVILSQFLKGIADGLHGLNEADASALSLALTSGYKSAYAAVARPVEGTMLTVMREAADALTEALPIDSIDSAIEFYLDEARKSLARTPDLLPILKKAGVVDSGASGIVCFFEGMLKYLLGEDIQIEESRENAEIFDFSLVNKDTVFDYGYCVEGLLQLMCDPDEFDHNGLKVKLSSVGNSIVTTVVGDKLKIHVHTKTLSSVMEYCQSVGEFLTIKIENMTLQNMQKRQNKLPEEKFLVREDDSNGDFGVVAVATSQGTQQFFSDMGADVVILSDIAPSSQDFIDAFSLVKNKNIIVFPNSSNSILTAMSAAAMYEGASVNVINCKSVSECYASLAIMDFDDDVASAISSAKDTISAAYEFSIYVAGKDVKFGSKQIVKDDYFSLSNNSILEIDKTFEGVVLATVKRVLETGKYSVITLFYGDSLDEEFIDYLIEKIDEFGFDAEVATVKIGNDISKLTVLCE